MRLARRAPYENRLAFRPCSRPPLSLLCQTEIELFDPGYYFPDIEFFLDAITGASVEQSGAWDAATQTITGGVALLVARVEPPPIPNGTDHTLIVGTMRSTDRVFANGFD